MRPVALAVLAIALTPGLGCRRGAASHQDAGATQYLFQLDGPASGSLSVQIGSAAPFTTLELPDGSAALSLVLPPSTQISIAAAPNAGYSIQGITGGCEGRTSQCTFQLDADTHLAVVFAPLPRYTLRVDGPVGGSIRVSLPTGPSTDLPDGAAAFTLTVPEGTLVGLEPTPGAGYFVKGFTGACQGAQSTCGIEMLGDLRAGVVFAPLAPAHLTVVVQGPGRIVSAGGGIDCGTHCTADAPDINTTLKPTLTAVPVDGAQTVSWQPCSPAAASCDLFIEPNTSLTLTATFAPLPGGLAPIYVQLAGAGRGSLSSTPSATWTCTASGRCSAGLPWGSQASLSVAPEVGSRFVGWANGCSGTASCTVTVPRSIAAPDAHPPLAVARLAFDVPAPRYTLIDLGLNYLPTAISSAGDVAGVVPPGSFPAADVFVRSAATGVISKPGFGAQFVWGVNRSGDIAAADYKTVLCNNHPRIITADFVFHTATATREPFDTYLVRAINDLGHIAGTSVSVAGCGDLGPGRAFLRDASGTHDLGAFDGGTSEAFALNGADLAVGAATVAGSDHAALFRGGGPVDLGLLPGGTGSVAVAINDSGLIAGNAVAAATTTNQRPIHAFVTDGGPLHDIGTLYGWDSLAAAIDPLGHVVGTLSVAPDIDVAYRAFLHDGSAMLDLNSRVSAPDWVLEKAVGISAAGWIAGSATVWGDPPTPGPSQLPPRRGFLLIPSP